MKRHSSDRDQARGAPDAVVAVIYDVDIAACNQAEKSYTCPRRGAADGNPATAAAEDRDRAINACVGANRGEAGIVLIYVDWTVHGCVVPARSRRVHGGGESRACG